MMSWVRLSLGRFGDERLEKRGLCCSKAWSRARAPAFVMLRAEGGVGSLGFGGSWPTRV
jgi:hypothetical protein